MSARTIPRAQQKLRNAFADGDVARTEEALLPSNSTYRLCGVEAAPASLSFVYEDGCQPVHYLCGEASPQLISLFPPKSLNRGATNDAARASLLYRLIEKGWLLDFDSVNLRGENPLHCCAKSGSFHVLHAVLGLAFTWDIAYDQAPRTGDRDFCNLTPLDIALSRQHWSCVRLLCYYGALSHSNLSVEASSTLRSTIHGDHGMSALASAVPVVFDHLMGGVKKLQQQLERAGDATGEVRILTGSKDLEQTLQGSVSNVMSPTGLSKSGAAALLAVHNYDERAAIEAYLDDPCGTLAAAGLPCGLSETGNMQSPVQPQNCIVCFDEIKPENNQTVGLPCGHPTCDECWRGIIRARLDDGDVHHTVCPAPDCNLPLPMEAAEKLLNAHLCNRFKSVLLKRFADSNPAIRWCPRPGCSNSIALFDGKVLSEGGLLRAVLTGRPVGVECMCGHRFCWVCLGPAHEPAACSHVREWQTTLKQLHEDDETRSVHWVNKETQMCPKCHSHIQRNGGCNHMKCTVCQQHFCYKCGRPWDGHKDFYQCRAVPDSHHHSNGEALPHPRPSHSEVRQFIRDHSDYDNHNPDDLKKIGKYMMAMLSLGCPRGDEGMCPALGGSSIENDNDASKKSWKDLMLKRDDRKSWTDWNDVRHLQILFETIESMVAEICLGQEVLQHSYILAFNMKRGRRRNYLETMQSQLLPSLKQLSSVIAKFPGFSEVVGMQWKKEDFLKEGKKRIGQMPDILRRSQFSYCMAITEFNTDIRDLSTKVQQTRCNITKSAWLGLFTEEPAAPRWYQTQPPRSSRESGKPRKTDWMSWIVVLSVFLVAKR